MSFLCIEKDEWLENMYLSCIDLLMVVVLIEAATNQISMIRL